MNENGWYTNRDWNDEISNNFFENLKNVKEVSSKGKYIRMQANILMSSDSIYLEEYGLSLMNHIFSDFSKDEKESSFNMIIASQDLGDYFLIKKDYLKASEYYLLAIENPFNIDFEFYNKITPILYIDCILKENDFDSYKKALSLIENFSTENLNSETEIYLFGKVGAFLYYSFGDTNTSKDFARKALRASKNLPADTQINILASGEIKKLSEIYSM